VNQLGMKFPAIVTPKGWCKIAGRGFLSRLGFVAMSFAEDFNSAFIDGIEPAIRDAGCEPLRVDKVHHNEKLCDRIIEIRRARFVVADVTGQRGVYYEAGFAAALGLPVIWSCREDDMNNIHFDTRQYNHVVWGAPADLHEKLRDRIIASIGGA
jgi:nucleoside 2-deoxyribosyltransferase